MNGFKWNCGDMEETAIIYSTSSQPVWLSGPDLVASKLLSGKVPQIEKAIRIVPHGQQQGSLLILISVQHEGLRKNNPP
jgi:hypothetical protein